MKFRGLVFLSAFALMVPQLATADPAQLTVVGEGKVQVVPDSFAIDARFFGVGPDAETAIESLSFRYASFKSDVMSLEGLETLTIKTENLSAESFQPCEGYLEDDVQSLDDCESGIFTGSMELRLYGSPASVAGNLVSYVSELGADRVQLDRFIVSDEEAAREQALLAAVENAKKKAARLASVSGMRLGPVIDVSDSVRFSDGFGSDRMVVVTGSQIRAPKYAIAVEPEPVEFSAQVKMVFQLMPAGKN